MPNETDPTEGTPDLPTEALPVAGPPTEPLPPVPVAGDGPAGTGGPTASPEEGRRWLVPTAIGAAALVVGLVVGGLIGSSSSSSASDADGVAGTTETVSHTVPGETVTHTHVATETATHTLPPDADAQAALDQQAADLATLQKELDAREADLDAREAALADKEKPEEHTTIPGSGTYFVGIDILAGTWTTKGGDGCEWERLSALDGDPDSVIASGDGSDGASVDVEETDLAFTTVDCDDWTLQK